MKAKNLKLVFILLIGLSASSSFGQSYYGGGAGGYGPSQGGFGYPQGPGYAPPQGGYGPPPGYSPPSRYDRGYYPPQNGRGDRYPVPSPEYCRLGLPGGVRVTMLSPEDSATLSVNEAPSIHLSNNYLNIRLYISQNREFSYDQTEVITIKNLNENWDKQWITTLTKVIARTQMTSMDDVFWIKASPVFTQEMTETEIRNCSSEPIKVVIEGVYDIGNTLPVRGARK